MKRQYRIWDTKENSWYRDGEYELLCIDLDGDVMLAYASRGEITSEHQIHVDISETIGIWDIHKNPIYSGDIIRFPADNDFEKDNYMCFEVFYNDDIAAYSISRTHFHGSVCGGYLPRMEQVCEMEIIGNIYQNKNLMK